MGNKVSAVLRTILPLKYCGAVIVAAGSATRMKGIDKNDMTSWDSSHINLNKDSKDNKDNSNIDGNTNTETKQTSSIDDVIYPMYLPVNTYLTNSEKVNKNDGERLILTFDGDNPFMLIEETVSIDTEHQIIPTYGDVELIGNSLAVINDNSANWFDNGIEYYVVSDVMSTEEMLDVVKSISVLPVSK